MSSIPFCFFCPSLSFHTQMTGISIRPLFDPSRLNSLPKLGFVNASSESNAAASAIDPKIKSVLGLSGAVRSRSPFPVKAMEESRMVYENRKRDNAEASRSHSQIADNDLAAKSDTNGVIMSNIGKSTNIVWQECSIDKLDRQKLLGQKGCVIWITGLSGSGKSTLACALSRALYSKGKLTYILDGDNVRHGLNKNLGFKAEDRAENIRRIGEVAKLFADAGIICIASLISPYRRDRDACRALMPDANFIEVFMNVPLEVCEARDPKGLYKLARAGKIKGFTGIDDPYEPPLSCEIEIRQEDGVFATPSDIAGRVASYLEERGFFHD